MRKRRIVGEMQNSKKRKMEDVKTKSSYTEYPRKKYNPDEDIPNNYSFLSLVCGLVAVLFGVFILLNSILIIV